MQVIFWKTRSRGRKSGKMSDRIRRLAGLMLAAGSVILCIMAAGTVRKEQGIRYRTGMKQEWGIPEIRNGENGTVSVNDADPDELRQLPRIGETLARMIIEEKLAHGPYFYPEDLEAVKGIGSATIELFRDMIDLKQGESGE